MNNNLLQDQLICTPKESLLNQNLSDLPTIAGWSKSNSQGSIHVPLSIQELPR